MNKAFIVYQEYRGRMAVCCYFDIKLTEFAWAIFTDNQCENNSALLFEKIYDLYKHNYKIEYWNKGE